MIYTIVVICVDSTERSEYMPLLIRSRPEHDYWICVCGFQFCLLFRWLSYRTNDGTLLPAHVYTVLYVHV